MPSFAAQLQLCSYKLWKDYYVSYSGIKEYIEEAKNFKSQTLSLEDVSKTFSIKILQQVEKIEQFYGKMEKELKERFEDLSEHSQNSNLQVNNKAGAVQHQYILQYSEQLEYLRDYVLLNTKAFTKLCTKFDRCLGTSLYTQLVEKVNQSYFYTSDALNSLQNALHSLMLSSVQKGTSTQIVGDLVSKPIEMKEFKVESLDRGRIYQIWVPLVTKPTGEAVSIPLLVARGAQKGPVLGIVSAIHGCELNGVGIVHRLFKQLDLQTLCGTIIAVLIANPIGFSRKQNPFSDGKDLNTVFPGKINGDCSQLFAYRLLHTIVVQMEYLVDLHTADFGKSLSYYIRVDTSDDTCSRMAFLMNPQIIVHQDAKRSSLSVSAMQLGIKSIQLAIGNPLSFQEKNVALVMTGLSRLMGFLKMSKYEETEVMVHQPTICKVFYWIYSDTGGVMEVLVDTNQWLKKDQKIAVIRSVFGKVIKEIFCPEDGIVIGKSSNPVATTGSKILHLGVPGREIVEKKKSEKKSEKENEED